MWALSVMSGVAGPAAVGGGMGSSGGASRDAEMADDGWGSADFDGTGILGTGDGRSNIKIINNGDEIYEFDEGEAECR